METKLKHRVIGALVITALLIIFLPAFFKGSSTTQGPVAISEQFPPPPSPPKPIATPTPIPSPTPIPKPVPAPLPRPSVEKSVATRIQTANNAEQHPILSSGTKDESHPLKRPAKSSKPAKPIPVPEDLIVTSDNQPLKQTSQNNHVMGNGECIATKPS